MKALESLIVLFVEDDPSHAEIILRTLCKHKVGEKIILLTDGQQALDFLFHSGEYMKPENSPTPDLILMNLRLPKVNGLEVYEKIKHVKDLKDIPFVILTNSKGEEEAINGDFKNSIRHFLIKPCEFNDFLNLFKDIGFVEK